MFKCRSHDINVKRRLYVGIVVPIALYKAETHNKRAPERRTLIVMEIRCLRSMYGVT